MEKVKINWWLAIPANIIVITILIVIFMAPAILAVTTHYWLWYLGFIPHFLILLLVIADAYISYQRMKYLAETYGELFNSN